MDGKRCGYRVVPILLREDGRFRVGEGQRKISAPFSAGYQKADDCTVSLKRIEFALERVKLRGKAE